MLQRQQDLVHAGYARGSRGVSDVAFDRAEAAVVLPGRLVFEYSRQSFQLDRIAQLRARTMRLDITNRVGIDLILRINRALQFDLTIDARCRYAVRPAVLIDP